MMREMIFILLLLVPLSPQAGHGLMNSFGDVEWLPEPGILPGDTWYFVDSLVEDAQCFWAELRGRPIAWPLGFAKEKLAEANALIRAHDEAGAKLAIARYLALLERATAIANAAETAEPRYQFINAVLEHVYILSADYVDLPLGIRASALSEWFAAAMAAFHEQRAALTTDEQNALFFKEEEIRWSVEMTTQADLQKIVNE